MTRKEITIYVVALTGTLGNIVYSNISNAESINTAKINEINKRLYDVEKEEALTNKDVDFIKEQIKESNRILKLLEEKYLKEKYLKEK